MAKQTIEKRIEALGKRIERRKQFIQRLGIPLEFWEKQLVELTKQAQPAQPVA